VRKLGGSEVPPPRKETITGGWSSIPPEFRTGASTYVSKIGDQPQGQQRFASVSSEFRPRPAETKYKAPKDFRGAKDPEASHPIHETWSGMSKVVRKLGGSEVPPPRKETITGGWSSIPPQFRPQPTETQLETSKDLRGGEVHIPGTSTGLRAVKYISPPPAGPGPTPVTNLEGAMELSKVSHPNHETLIGASTYVSKFGDQPQRHRRFASVSSEFRPQPTEAKLEASKDLRGAMELSKVYHPNHETLIGASTYVSKFGDQPQRHRRFDSVSAHKDRFGVSEPPQQRHHTSMVMRRTSPGGSIDTKTNPLSTSLYFTK